MASMKPGIKKQWDIEAIANDLRQTEWYITEGPRDEQQFVRIDRMTFLADYPVIEGLARDLLSKKEIKEAEKTDTLPEVLQDATDEYMDALAELVGDVMGEHVYGTFEEGSAFAGQYEEGPFKELSEKFKIAKEDLKYHRLEGSSRMSGPSMDGGQGARELATQFVNGATSGTAGNMYIHGNRIYSYGPHFPVAERRHGVIYLTTRKYSQTTSTHVNAVKRAAEEEGFEIIPENLPPEV